MHLHPSPPGCVAKESGKGYSFKVRNLQAATFLKSVALFKPCFAFLTGSSAVRFSDVELCHIESLKVQMAGHGGQLLTVGALDSSASGTWRAQVLLERLSSYFFLFFFRAKDKVANLLGLCRSSSESLSSLTW